MTEKCLAERPLPLQPPERSLLCAAMTETASQIWIRRVAAILAAGLVAIVAYVLISDGDKSGEVTEEVIGADAAQLSQLAGGLDHPVYWAGPDGAETFEWTEASDGRVYIRYLTDGAEPEDPSPNFLTVGTYPVGDGLRAVRKSARQPGSKTFDLENGGLALVSENNPVSVYLAYPGSEYQIEVFDPDPVRALRLVTSGQIKPVP
jgi:hypothetical protein